MLDQSLSINGLIEQTFALQVIIKENIIIEHVCQSSKTSLAMKVFSKIVLTSCVRAGVQLFWKTVLPAL